MRQPLLRRALLTAVLLVVVMGGAFLLRGWAVRRGLESLRARLAQHGISFRHGDHHWDGWRQLRLQDISLHGPHGLHLEAATVSVRVRPWAGVGLDAIEQVDAPSMHLSRGRLTWDVQACARPGSGHVALQVRQANARRPGDQVSGLAGRIWAGRRDGAWQVAGDWREFSLRHRRLSAASVELPAGRMTLSLRPQRDRVVLEAGSHVAVGGWQVLLGGTYSAAQGQLDLHAQSPLQPADALLQAWPAAMRGTLCNARLGGCLGGSGSLSFRLGHPETLVLNAALRDSALALQGGIDFAAWRRAAQAGPRWSDRLPAPVLKALLLSEDAGFMAHRGFDPGLIGSALAQDWASGEFVRGGGTLSMQLMRNLFLRREKHLARKAEEALLTLLVERCGLLSKAEILDLYLDCVEWGPGVYGIAAASQHYFDCRPDDLALDQGLFLMAALPNPRMAHTLLQPDGRLTSFTQGYYDGMRWLLYEAGVVPEEVLDADYPVFEGIAARGAGRI